VRVHKDGYIQARDCEIALPPARIRRALSVGMTRATGIEREVEDYLGVEIEGALRFRVIQTQTESFVRIESDWVRPSRS